MRFFQESALFLGRHKIIVSVCAVLVLLVTAGFVVVNHYLDKINYEPVNVQQIVTKPTIKTIKLFNGEVISLEGLVKNEDGTYTLPDGRRID